MAEDPKKSKWITSHGKKVEIKPGERVEDAISRIGKSEYIQRYGCIKSFKVGDKVSFNKYTQTGEVYNNGYDTVKIFGDDGMSHTLNSQTVFKTDELSFFGHWDTMVKLDRKELLKNCGIGLECSDRNWYQLNEFVKEIIIKNISAPGYEGNANSNTKGRYNPVSTDKTIAEKIDEDLKDKKKDG